MGVEAGRGELGDHLQKSVLTHKRGGEENQRELQEKKVVGVSSSGPYV